MATTVQRGHPAPTSPAHSHAGSLSIKRLGLWLFILSESFLFVAMLASRFYLHGVDRPEHLNQILGLGVSLVLLVSSLTAYRAEIAAAHGDQKGLRLNLLLTLAMGLIFVAGVSYEWSEAFNHFPPHTGFGTIFFSLTGLHAFHVMTGMTALFLVYRLSRDGRYGPGNSWAVEGSVKYWHFVDLAWVFIYPTLYLVS